MCGCEARRARRHAAFAGCLLLTACHQAPPPPPVTPPAATVTQLPTEPLPDPNVAVDLTRPAIASAYQRETPYTPATIAAHMPPYTVKPDLSNVANVAQLSPLSDAERAHLAADGFVALPTGDGRLDEVYARNAAGHVPGFVSADTVLWAFDRVTADARARLTHDSLPALLTALTLTWLQRSEAQLAAVAGPELKDAARRNVALLDVAARLLGLRTAVDAGAARLADEEMKRLAAHAAREASGVVPGEIDYRDYRPPAGDGEEARFEAAAQWLALAAMSPRQADRDEPDFAALRQMLLLGHALAQPPDRPLRQWEALADTLAFFGGRGREAGLDAVLAAAEAVSGPRRSLRDGDDPDKLRAVASRLKSAVHLLPAPVRFDDELLAALAPRSPGGLATGLAFFQALGQPRAETLMVDGYRVNAKLPAYAEALGAARARFKAFEARDWQADVVRGRLWAIAGLPPSGGEGRPLWQERPAWADKCLLTSLAAWIAGRHAPETGGGGVVTEEKSEAPGGDPPPAYVEPAPETYGRLAALTEDLAAGLRRHDLLPPGFETRLDGLIGLCRFLKQVSETELRNESVSDADRRRLAGYSEELRRLAGSGGDGVAMVAPLGHGVEGAIGPPLAIYAVVPDRGKLYLARGALLSYHELRSGGENLTDARWGIMLDQGTASGQPEWAASFIVPNPYDPKLPVANAPPVWSR